MPRRKNPDTMTAEEEIHSVLEWARRTAHVNIAAALRPGIWQNCRTREADHAEAASSMTDDQLPTEIAPADRMLTAAEFHRLADVPPEIEWFANLTQPQHPARLRKRDEGFHAVHRHRPAGGISHRDPRARHRLARRLDARDERGESGGSTVRHRLAALASLFEYLCEKNAVTHNPVKGVERPKTESGEGKTPAIGDHQARELLGRAAADTIKSKRDRAILSTLLFHALRREELCKLKVGIFGTRAKACRTSRCPAKAARRGICRCIPAPTR